MEAFVENPLLIRDLSKSFGGLRAVDRVNIELRPHHVHSLIGPNGAGKTTVLNCVSGFLQPDSGHVILEGSEVTRWLPHRLVTAGLVRTFQITTIFTELTVTENVELAVRSHLGRNFDVFHQASRLGQAQNEAQEVLGTVGLLDRAGARGDQLSYGDKRVVEVAIALALNPKVLLLDEPTAGMSRSEAGRIAKLVRKIADKTSIVLVEHDTETVLSISDEITVMAQGRVIAHGTPGEISRDAEVRKAYLGALDAEVN
jgi:branched-chain amino acid transport system ATP-binding protein